MHDHYPMHAITKKSTEEKLSEVPPRGCVVKKLPSFESENACLALLCVLLRESVSEPNLPSISVGLLVGLRVSLSEDECSRALIVKSSVFLWVFLWMPPEGDLILRVVLFVFQWVFVFLGG